MWECCEAYAAIPATTGKEHINAREKDIGRRYLFSLADAFAQPTTAERMKEAAYILYSAAFIVREQDAALSQSLVNMMDIQLHRLSLYHPEFILTFKRSIFDHGTARNFVQDRKTVMRDIIKYARAVAKKKPLRALKEAMDIAMLGRKTAPEISVDAFRVSFFLINDVIKAGHLETALQAAQAIAQFATKPTNEEARNKCAEIVQLLAKNASDAEFMGHSLRPAVRHETSQPSADDTLSRALVHSLQRSRAVVKYLNSHFRALKYCFFGYQVARPFALGLLRLSYVLQSFAASSRMPRIALHGLPSSPGF